MVLGKERETGDACCIINVYAPCDDVDQLPLWDRLNLVINQWADMRVCLIGDFNTILEVGKRDGEGSRALSRGSRGLKELVENGGLRDIKLQGHNFTWFRCNGKCKSCIDRAIVNDNWLERWSNTSL